MSNFNQKIGEMDFNIYAPDEYGFNNGINIKQGYHLFIQEIQYLFDTEKGDVFGSDFGSEARKMIWRQNVSEQTVSETLTREIKQYCDKSNDYRFRIDVKFMKGSSRDMAVVDIDIETSEDSALFGGVIGFQYTFS